MAYPGVDERMILKWNLKKYICRVWVGLKWTRIESIGDFL
jgi:hypothetical protein